MTTTLIQKFQARKDSLPQLSHPSTHDPHIANLIYGLPVVQTSEPVVVSAFTGVGKTRTLCHWLADNYKNQSCEYKNQYVIAFKEVKLLAEFACDLYDHVRERKSSESKHLPYYIKYVFGIDDELLVKTRQFYSHDEYMLKRIMNFLGKVTASTSLNKERIEELHKARIILTTHESLQNLGCVGLVEGKVGIYDEAPANCFQVHKLRQDQNKEEHVKSYLYDAKCIDLPKQTARRIGKFLSKGFWGTSECFQLAPTEIQSLNDISCEKVIRESAIRFCSDSTPKDRHSGVVLDPPVGGVSPHFGLLANNVQPYHFTHFYVSYLKLEAFKAKSLTILTACPEGTTVAWLEQLSGKKFQTFESDESLRRRELVKVAAICTPMLDDNSISCSKANSKSRAAMLMVDSLVKVLVTYGNDAFAICHGWIAVEVSKARIACCKVGQTGVNSFRDCHVCGVFNLPFPTPEDQIIDKHVFGEGYEHREDMRRAGELGQSIMRSPLRKKIPEQTVIAYFDENVKKYWDLFVNN